MSPAMLPLWALALFYFVATSKPQDPRTLLVTLGQNSRGMVPGTRSHLVHWPRPPYLF